MAMPAELVLDLQCNLGEGCLWDYARRHLLFVDIEQRQVFIYEPLNNDLQTIQLERRPGTVVPRHDGKLLVAQEGGVALFTPETEELENLAEVEKDLAGNRFNDGKCDPAGRFWFGSVVEDMQELRASLYSMDGGLNPKRMLSGVTNSNGIAWSLDHRTMYYIDTPTRRVFAFDYDLASGEIGNRRSIIKVPESMGWPDGMTIDSEGKLWVALFMGAGVSRWDPDSGSLLEFYPVPAPHVTSCAFGGADLDELYVTTARFMMSPQDIKAYPQSGGLFRIKPPFTGVPCFEFA